MLPAPKFCPICGTAYPVTDTWPKRCSNSTCKHEDYGNPPTVAVVVCGIGERALVVRRNINPGLGRLGCPGGWVNRDEGLRAAAARELKEETERRDARTDEVLIPGIKLAMDDFDYLGDFNVPGGNRNLLFYSVRPAAESKIARWWDSIQSAIRELASGDVWNNETQTLHLLTREEIEAEGVAFSSHLDMLQRWFVQRVAA
jgi:8-oxo-dGTP pyrophosphatase MutT (NUDIX family)